MLAYALPKFGFVSTAIEEPPEILSECDLPVEDARVVDKPSSISTFVPCPIEANEFPPGGS